MRPFEPCDYTILNGKRYCYLNDDNPSGAYTDTERCFVAQPLAGKDINIKHNIITVPLMMTDEWDIIQQQPGLVNTLRSQKKTYMFNYVGQCGYKDREVFRGLQLLGYDFEETQPIYGLPGEKKKQSLIKFLYRISRARFVFCPRGMGSSSFRAYQAMMVGSIPIITGMNDYPFSDEVDWSTICIRGSISDVLGLAEQAMNMSDREFHDMRESAINFWDNYCRHDALYGQLEKYEYNKNSI